MTMGHQLLAHLIHGMLRLRRGAGRGLPYQDLLALSDRQLEDIGLTRNLVETVMVQGDRDIAALLPDGAARDSLVPAANSNRTAGAA